MEKINFEEVKGLVTHFIDFESSGLSPDSYPIEIAVAYSPDTYVKLIKPAYYWEYWDQNAQELHKITQAELLANGSDIEELTDELNDLFSKKILWADSNYDKMWMDNLYEAANKEMTFKVGNIYSCIPHLYQPLLLQEIGSTIEHRALPDALRIEKAWYSFMEKYSI